MALKKNITLDNGIVLSYHRIVSVNIITNQSSIIEVASYLNQEQRQREKLWYENNSQDDMNVYINATYHSKEYDKELNVDKAYKYLKTLDIFKDAEDVFEETIEVEDIIPEETIPEEVIENTEEIHEESTGSEEPVETEEIKEEE